MAKVTVSADYAGFAAGKVLTSDADVCTYYRALIDEGEDEKRAGNLSDEQIIAVVNTVGGDGDDDEQIEALGMLVRMAKGSAASRDNDDAETEADGEDDADDKTDETAPAVADEVSAATGRLSVEEKEAETLAAAMAGDAELNKHFREIIAAGDTIKIGPSILVLDVRRLYPNDQQRMGWPIVGSSWKLRPKGSTTPVDKRRVLKPTSKGLKPTTVSWYDLLFGFTEYGAELQNKIDMVGRYKTDREANKPNPYSKLKPHDANAEHDHLVAQRTQARTAFKRAVKLDRKLLECGDLRQPGRGVVVSVDTSKSPRYPIVILDQVDNTAERFSIDKFLGMNPDVAKDPKVVATKGGVFQALVTSGGEDGNEPDTPSEDAMDIEMFMASTGMLASFIGNNDQLNLVKKRLREDDHFLASMTDLHDEIHSIVNEPKNRARYAKVAAEDKKKAAA